MEMLRRVGGTFCCGLLFGLLVSLVPAGAQTLSSLAMERTIALNSVLSTITANIPANVLASIASGALEIREQTNFNPQGPTMTSTVFVVQAGSPIPTSLSAVPFNAYLAIVALTPDKIYITKTAVQLVGTITQSNTTPFGNYQGAPATFSFGYTADTPPKINTVIETVAGVVAVYSSAATGTFAITQPPGGGGGGGGATGVTIVVNGSTSATPTFQTTVNQLILDASASTSTNAGALTYAWAIPQGSPSAVISFPGGNTAKAFVQLSGGKSTYQFKLTVIDSTGENATVTITLQYL